MFGPFLKAFPLISLEKGNVTRTLLYPHYKLFTGTLLLSQTYSLFVATLPTYLYIMFMESERNFPSPFSPLYVYTVYSLYIPYMYW